MISATSAPTRVLSESQQSPESSSVGSPPPTVISCTDCPTGPSASRSWPSAEMAMPLPRFPDAKASGAPPSCFFLITTPSFDDALFTIASNSSKSIVPFESASASRCIASSDALSMWMPSFATAAESSFSSIEREPSASNSRKTSDIALNFSASSDALISFDGRRARGAVPSVQFATAASSGISALSFASSSAREAISSRSQTACALLRF